MVPRIFTPEQRETQMNICADILQNTENDPKLLRNTITSHESQFFQYDPETKFQSMHRKTPRSPRKKKEKRKNRRASQISKH
jgi:hypothetical protein